MTDAAPAHFLQMALINAWANASLCQVLLLLGKSALNTGHVVQLQDAGIDPPQFDDFYLSYGRAPSATAYWSQS